MKKKAKGKFSVEGSPEPIGELEQKIGTMRMKFEKRFEGPLEANGIVSMMGIMDQELGSGGYVAMERVTGSLDGKQGSFCLQHSCTMFRGKQKQEILVIPDTGAGDLKGLSGQITIDIADDGQHYYTFEYEFLTS